ncbi:uracil-DNA glycosylase [Periweissella cryptocerci]|uniref:Uracil-DNA glycosylase n=1 Tax=Periweissella cryptocerci TaxID=2506420 RepID=A0A4P6YV88_9LACO|nr:uracil-DNA glycosylase [Periweissella cryptocerci]QBO36702.1 uracil-DNA glycosylase [Periweissella cryptocerci]
MTPFIHNDWWPILAPVLQTPEFNKLSEFVHQEYATANVYPPKAEVFAAFERTGFADTKVVILGQDPYHEQGQAQGLSFSVALGIKLPPSLRNIYQELNDDLGIKPVEHGCLIPWTKQGVLLLNTVLTVREGAANSHKGHGWETITDEAIRALSAKPEPVVFILWGKPAQLKLKLIDQTRNFTITSSHPSPLSSYRGFFGSKPFSKTNELLVSVGETPIDWQLPAQPIID